MTSRREVILGGLVTVAMLNLRPASARTSARSDGCLICREQARRILSRNSGVQMFASGKEEIASTSGDRAFDYALAQSLAQMAETFEVHPGFGFYSDANQAQAMATEERRLSRADGTVLFGKTLLTRLRSLPDHPSVAVATVCAHEFAHIVQFKHGLTSKLQGSDPTVRRVELHADFLAGYFAGTRRRQRPGYPAVVFATTAYDFGDFARGNVDHHGLPKERAAAVVHGFKAAHGQRRSLSDAIQYGVNYARSV